MVYLLVFKLYIPDLHRVFSLPFSGDTTFLIVGFHPTTIHPVLKDAVIVWQTISILLYYKYPLTLSSVYSIRSQSVVLM